MPPPIAKPTRLPATICLQVEGPGGKFYPAWIERWKRTVFAACGPVSRSVPVLVVSRRRVRRPAKALIEKLRRWGYAHVGSVHEKPEEKE